VVANVVRNAVVHTDDDVPIAVTVSVAHDASVVIEVRDEGAGMSPELVARVTQRFVRADPSRSRQRGGSGLGLSIAEAAVAAHGGAFRIDSRPGNGTTVTITLPAAAAP
jgi:two-component system OmpR family sensor kinase